MARLLSEREQVGPYRVVGVLGHGGVGTTYLAEEVASGQRVALKELRLWHGGDWKALDLFEREARVLAQIVHPQIPRYVSSFTVESEEGPAFYLAQELAPGRSLYELVRSGYKPSEKIVRGIAGQLLAICEALQLWQPPIIHRDIKPANVMYDETGVVRLVDFGAVRDTYRSTAQGSTIVGTFGYMAPEQLYGRAVPATDVFGVAATVLTLVTGLTPDQLPRKNERPDLRKLKLSRGFREWLERALAPDPAKRFASARAASVALAGVDSAAKRGVLRAVVLGLLVGGVVAPTFGYVAHRYFPRAGAGSAKRWRPGTPWIPAKGRLKYAAKLSGHMAGVFSARFSGDGRNLVTGGADGTAKLWDVATRKATRSFPAADRSVRSAQFSADGKSVLLASSSELRLFGVENRKPIRTFSGKNADYFHAAISPDGSLIAATRRKGGIALFKSDGTELEPLEQPGIGLAVAFDPDGGRLASTTHDSTLRVWTLATRQARSLNGHTAPISDVAFSSDGKALVSGSDDHTVRVWQVEPGRLWRTYEGFADEVWAVAYSPDGKLVAGGCKDGSVRIWEVFGDALVDSLPPNGKPVTTLSFSPDGRQLVIAAGNVTLWSLRDPPWEPPEIKSPVLAATTPPAGAAPAEKLCTRAQALLDETEGNRKQLDEVDGLAKKALEVDPKHAKALVLRSHVAQMRGYLKNHDYRPEAIESARQLADAAIALDPKLVEARTRKGWVLLDAKDRDGALRELEAARKIDPKDAEVAFLAMEIAERDGRYDEALLHARNLFEASNDARVRDRVYGSLSEIYSALEEWDAADRTYRSLLNLRPTSAWTRINYSSYLRQRERYDEAIKMARASLALVQTGMGRYQLATAEAMKAVRLLRTDGKLDDAEKLLDDASEEFPGTAQEHYGRGLLAMRRGDRRAARRAFERALEAEPDYAAVKRALKALGPS